MKRSMTQYHHQYKNGQYTPLLDMNNQRHMLERLHLIQASQPNLCIGFKGDEDDVVEDEEEEGNSNDIESNINNNSLIADDCHSFGHIHKKESFTRQERAFSLTNLIPQKVEILSFNEYNNSDEHRNNNTTNHTNEYHKSKNCMKYESSSPSVNTLIQHGEKEQHRPQHERIVLINNKINRLKQNTTPTTLPSINTSTSNTNQCIKLKSSQSKHTTDDITNNPNSITTSGSNNNSYCTVSFV